MIEDVTTTVISKTVAQALGIDPNDPSVDSFGTKTVSGTVPLKGYYIDEFSVVTTDLAKYSISNPLVYVDASSTPSITGGFDVIIGSNYFLDTKILIDGPRNRILLSQAELGQVTLEKPPTIYELAGQWLESFVDWLADWFP